ncbi:thioredoxin family protein [Staphylococcus simulans]|uniref:thioredoxin family protein n=1 Tax=Staphylococcus simulans TaxID=1286 RepID=UPI000D03FD3F|nr:thioredoxin family protein [Staphylococcus simulans]
MAKLETYYKDSQDLDTYISQMKENKEGLLKIYEDFKVPENDTRIDQIKQKNYDKVLVISEDWCGDAMMNVAILKHISELLNLEVHVFHRDQDTDLIDRYLTNGKSRSIPIFIFLNDKFEQENVWGPRAKAAQVFVEKTRSKLVPKKDAPDYDEAVQHSHVVISNRFKTDSNLWKEVYDSIIDKLLNP